MRSRIMLGLMAVLSLLAVGWSTALAQGIETVDPTPDSVTFAMLLTAAGTGVAAAIITGLVQLIKTVLPHLDARVSGALMAFVLSAILYVLAGIAVGVDQLDEGLVTFVAWLTCASASVGIYSTVKHASESGPP